MYAAQTAIEKVYPLSYDMMLLGEPELCMEFQEVRQVGEFVAPAFRQYHEYLVANYDRIQLGKGENGLGEAELYASLACRRYIKASAHLSRADVDFQDAARQKISPHSMPEGKLRKSVESELPPRPLSAPQNPYRRLSPLDWNAGDTADPAEGD